MAEIITPFFGRREGLKQKTPAGIVAFESGVALLHELRADRAVERFQDTGDEAALEVARLHIYSASACRRAGGDVPSIVMPQLSGIGFVAGSKLPAHVPGFLREVVRRTFPGQDCLLCGTSNQAGLYDCFLLRFDGAVDAAAWHKARKIVRMFRGIFPYGLSCGVFVAGLRTINSQEHRPGGDGWPIALPCRPFNRIIAFARSPLYDPEAVKSAWQQRRVRRARAKVGLSD